MAAGGGAFAFVPAREGGRPSRRAPPRVSRQARQGRRGARAGGGRRGRGSARRLTEPLGSRWGFWRCVAAGQSSGGLGTSHGRVTAAASGAPGFLETLPGREADSLLKTWLLIAVVLLSLIFDRSIVQQFCLLPYDFTVRWYPLKELYSQAICTKAML